MENWSIWMSFKLYFRIFNLFHNEKLNYRTIGLHRSSISAYHKHIDGMPVSKTPSVSSLMPGVFNLHPPKPKYIFIWDVQVVINFIKSQCWSTDTLSERELNLKLFVSLARTIASSSSSLHHLYIRYLVNTGSKVTFHFHKLHKSWKKGKAPPSVTVYSYIADE